MVEKTFTKRLLAFLVLFTVIVVPVSATGGSWQDLGGVGGLWQDLGNLGGIWSDSSLGTVFGDTNLDTIPFSGIGASDSPARWSPLARQTIFRGSPDGTIAYPNIYAQCDDPDGPELITVASTHTKFSLYIENNDLKIKSLDPTDQSIHGIVLDCNGIRAGFDLWVTNPPNQPPTANAGPDKTVDVNDVITFDGSGSSDSDGTITTFIWNFGDGTTATGRTATHAFTALGTFTVTLTVTDNNGATASDTAVVIANGRPTAVLSCPSTGRVGETLMFDARQSTDDTQIVSYSFNFGDDTTAVQQAPTITKAYERTGVFTVTLTVTDDDNLSHRTSCAVTIAATANLPPTANAGPDKTVSVNNVVIFDGSASTDTDGTITRYEWRFSDGMTLIGRIVQRAFSAVGQFLVTLMVTDDDGATGTDTARIIANGIPTAVLNCRAATVNQPAVIDASQSTDDTLIVSYAFNFGDGTSASSASPFELHTYGTTGNFNVLLTVTDDDGLTDTESCSITVRTAQPKEEEAELERLVFSHIEFNEIAHAGETLELSITMANDGPRELEDMTLTAFIYDLDARAAWGPFDLDNGDSETELLLLNIPEHAEGRYDIEIIAGNDNIKQNTYRTITIR